MALNWTPTAGNFNDTLYTDLLNLEAPVASDRLNGKLVFVNGNVNFTIGIGFDLIAGGDQVQAAVFAQLGLKATPPLGSRPTGSGPSQTEYDFANELLTAINAHKGSTDLNAIMARRVAAAQLDPTYATYLGATPRSTFSFAGETEVRQTFDALWAPVYRQAILNKWPELQGNASFSSSKELIALASMIWNGGPGILGLKLRAALQTGNRAEAWFEIRYGSNGGSSQSPGIAKRRFVESQVFGLYDTGAPSADAAKAVFSMLAKNRDVILTYDSQYGAPPDGSASTRNMIAEANNDANLRAITTTQNLVNALTPARDAFIALLNTQLPPGTAPLVASEWNPAAIAYNSPTQPQAALDARPLDDKGQGMDKNLLVGNGGAESLFGGAGDDFLFGGGGNNSLQGGAGNDTLIGGKDNDVLNGGTDADLYVVAAYSGTDTITSSEAADQLKLDGRVLNGDGTLLSDSATLKQWMDSTKLGSPITYRYEVPTQKLTVVGAGSVVVINDFVDGDVGIFIPKKPKTKSDPNTNTNFRNALPAPIRRDPLAIDLNGNGIETVGIGATPILFDHNADGIRTGTGWVQANDAWLVLDRNGNGGGSINSGCVTQRFDTNVDAASFHLEIARLPANDAHWRAA